MSEVKRQMYIITTLIASIIILLFLSCTSYKTVLVPTDEKTLDGISKNLSKNIKENQLYLSFTTSFEQSKIKILEGNKVLHDSLMPIESKYIAKAFKVCKDSLVTVSFSDIKEPLLITQQQMKNYKFIYIEKKHKKVTVEFNNTTKSFSGQYILD